MKTNLKNVFVQALKPKRFLVMCNKVRKRFLDAKGHHSDMDNFNWIKSNTMDFKRLARDLDEALWEETEKVSHYIKKVAEKKLVDIDYELGGGGVYPFLYFITRYTKPNSIVETGVAAGFSSYAFLLGIKANGDGRLFSSDFPYFRLPNPEQYIGIIVEEELKKRWDLLIDGDTINLPIIISKISKIDIFHYDSDKSYSGRSFAISQIENSLDENSLIIMDDIQTNSHFYDLIEEKHPDSWYIFEFLGKYIGMIGSLRKADF